MKPKPDATLKAVLADPSAPAELKAQARAKLGLAPEPAARFEYTPALDSVVQSFWNTRPPIDPEAPPRDACALRLYEALVTFNLLGGSSNAAQFESDVEVVIAAFAKSESSWVRGRCESALHIALHLPAPSTVNKELGRRIKQALDE